MRRGTALPAHIESRLGTLGATLDRRPEVRFAYLFGGAGRHQLRPLSDVDVAVYIDDATADRVQARLDLIGVVEGRVGPEQRAE
ncbi:MAG TPA: nucleotidyltransferase domain-containing protein [Methylomirabilota bacterium]|nr:nucleotidyltransferase domain-containing protein [Methylomirabilota bacterium]